MVWVLMLVLLAQPEFNKLPTAHHEHKHECQCQGKGGRVHKELGMQTKILHLATIASKQYLQAQYLPATYYLPRITSNQCLQVQYLPAPPFARPACWPGLLQPKGSWLQAVAVPVLGTGAAGTAVVRWTQGGAGRGPQGLRGALLERCLPLLPSAPPLAAL